MTAREPFPDPALVRADLRAEARRALDRAAAPLAARRDRDAEPGPDEIAGRLVRLSLWTGDLERMAGAGTIGGADLRRALAAVAAEARNLADAATARSGTVRAVGRPGRAVRARCGGGNSRPG